MILAAYTPATPENTHLPPLMQPHHSIDAPAQQPGNLPIRAVETIRQDDIVALQRGMQAMEEHGLTALRALDPPAAAPTTAPQASDNTTTRRATGKPSPGFCASRFAGARSLRRLRVRRREPRAVDNLTPCTASPRLWVAACWSR